MTSAVFELREKLLLQVTPAVTSTFLADTGIQRSIATNPEEQIPAVSATIATLALTITDTITKVIQKTYVSAPANPDSCAGSPNENSTRTVS